MALPDSDSGSLRIPPMLRAHCHCPTQGPASRLCPAPSSPTGSGGAGPAWHVQGPRSLTSRGLLRGGRMAVGWSDHRVPGH
eukprot:768814-Hanusia_phi.AAC.4